jgi:hypothetical protein
MLGLFHWEVFYFESAIRVIEAHLICFQSYVAACSTNNMVTYTAVSLANALVHVQDKYVSSTECLPTSAGYSNDQAIAVVITSRSPTQGSKFRFVLAQLKHHGLS